MTPAIERITWPACIAMVLVALAACGGDRPAAVRSVEESHEARAAAMREAMKVKPGEDVPLSPVLAAAPRRSIDQIAFEFSWDLQLPAPVHRSWIDPDLPDLLFYQLVTGEIHGIEARSGMTRFVTEPLVAPLEYPVDVVRRKRIRKTRNQESSIFDDRFYCIVQSQLICFEAEKGHVVWRFDLPFEPSTGPHVEGGADNTRIFIGDWAGRIQVVSYDFQRGMPFVVWQHHLRGGVPQARAAGAEELVYIPDMSGTLTCFDLDRDLKWRFQGYGPLRSPPALRGRRLYIGADDNVLHVINRLSGARLGSLYLGAPIWRTPMVFDNEPQTVYAWTEGPEGGLHAIHAEPDQVEYTDVAEPRFPLEVERLAKRWFVPDVTDIVGSSPRQLYLTAPGSAEIIAVDKKTGNLDWRWKLADAMGARPAHLTTYVDHQDLLKSLFAVDPRGHVVAYRIFGQFSR
ncbi:MAG: PQQ-binding-like beta-propeller repeat protein [Planctomycetota bacterium]